MESGKTTVATVSADFALNVLGNGTSKITVQYTGRKVKGTVKVMLPAFSKEKLTLKDRPVLMKIKNLPTGAIPEYESSDPKVAKVNKEGYVAPASTGTAVVTAKVGNVVTTCTVTVK